MTLEHDVVELQNQQNENVIAVKTLESGEIAGHLLTEVQVLAPMMSSEEIASINAVYAGETRSVSEGTWVVVA